MDRSKNKEMERNSEEKEKRQKAIWGKNKFMKSIVNMIRTMVFNVQGINCPYKRQEIELYAEDRSISLGILSETQHAHTSEEGGAEKEDTEGKAVRGKYKLFYSSGRNPEDVEKAENGKRTKKENT